MKKPNVLNRAMFNRGGTSAYGRGITSNLVTEEQRQRFNYGGRVGAWNGISIGSGRGSNYGYGKVPEIISQEDLYKSFGGGNYASRNIMDQIVEEEVGSEGDVIERKAGDIFYEQKEKSDKRKAEADALGVSVSELDAIERDQKSDQTQREMVKEELFENFKPNPDDPPGPEKKIMADSDTMDWESILGPTEEQKRRTKGEAQLGLAAGALDVFSQPTIAKGMKAASPHLLNLGKTATADQKARDKAILQGKVLSKVYTDRAGAKGEQDRLTAAAKGAADTPSNLFWGILDAAKVKAGKPKDFDYAYAYERATQTPVKIIKKEEDKAAIEANSDQFKDQIFVMGTRYLKLDKAGKLKDITQEVLESFKG